MIILKDLMDLPGLNNLMEVTEECSYDHLIKGISFVFHEKDIAHIKEANLVICSDCLEQAILLPLIPILAAKKTALMIVGGKNVFDTAIFEHANACNLPTFLMNGGAFLYDFVQKFYQEEAQKTDAPLIDRFLNRYTANAGEGIANILRTLEQIIKMPVFIFDCDNKPLLFVKEWELAEESAFEQLEKKYSGQHILKYSLGSSGNLYVICKTKKLSWQEEKTVRNSLLALATGVADYHKIYEEKRNKLIYDILKRKILEDEINKSQIRAFRLNPTTEYLCIALEVKGQNDSAVGLTSLSCKENAPDMLSGMSRTLDNALRKRFQNEVIVLTDDKTLLIFWPVEHQSEIAKKAANEIVKNVMDGCGRFFQNNIVTIGVSAVSSSIARLYIPYNEAAQALQLGAKIFGPGSLTHFDDLSMYRILLEMDDVSRIDRSLGLINKIIEYDQSNNTELMHTLEVYYENNFNLKTTARQLFLHYNSIQYRLKKISDITDLDIMSSDGVFTLMVGMKLKNYSK